MEVLILYLVLSRAMNHQPMVVDTIRNSSTTELDLLKILLIAVLLRLEWGKNMKETRRGK